jgi:trans-aconitate methyltransferase
VSQDGVFLEGEGDRWFERNSGCLAPAGADEPVLGALSRVQIAAVGTMLDVGGATGWLSAGFLRLHPGWGATVLEPSRAAMRAGQGAFPGVTFRHGTAADASSLGVHDLVIASFVLHWVDRTALSRSIASIDAALADGGLLAVADFHPERPRANRYVHRPGVMTYKQDYAACFTALGTYRLLVQHGFEHGSGASEDDPFDRRCAVWVLRKDLEGGYARR